VAGLALLGAATWLLWRALRPDRFVLFLLVALLFSPLAAAVTKAPGAQRAMPVGLYMFLFSVYGLAYLTSLRMPTFARGALVGAVALAYAAQAVPYLRDYFTAYPERSETAFDSYDLHGSTLRAIQHEPSQVLVAAEGMHRVHFQFLQLMLPVEAPMPLIRIEQPEAQPNSCLVYWGRSDSIARTDRYVVTVDEHDHRVKLRCWAGLRPERLDNN
jgi:hypothetical protein